MQRQIISNGSIGEYWTHLGGPVDGSSSGKLDGEEGEQLIGEELRELGQGRPAQ
jgi:hypothetical protein